MSAQMTQRVVVYDHLTYQRLRADAYNLTRLPKLLAASA
jgi:hypothetical protein